MNFADFVLAASTADLAEEPRAREHADAVEFRMDLAEEPLAALSAYDGELPVLATNRATWEGGEAGGDPGSDPERRRLDDLAAAAREDPVAAVDVELRCLDGGPDERTGDDGDGQRGVDAAREGGDGRRVVDAAREGGDGRRVVDAAREAGTAVLVSVHDFERTPAPDRMRSLLESAAAVGDVGKLAVTAAGPDDVLALLSVTRDLTAAGRRVATMAMGEPGRHSRAVAPLYGSRIGYAPVDPANATAPGQFDLATLSELVDRLGGEVDRPGGESEP